MARSVMPSGKPFQKGVSGNPGGLTETTRKLATLRREQGEQARSEIREALTPELRKDLVLSCVKIATKKGDVNTLVSLFELAYGKIESLDPESFQTIVGAVSSIDDQKRVMLIQSVIGTKDASV